MKRGDGVRSTHMLETLFHEYGLRVTAELSLVILQGPFSWNRPIMDELPGCHKQLVGGPCGTEEGQGLRRR